MYIHTWLTARGSTTKQTEIGANTNMAKTYLDSAVGMFFSKLPLMIKFHMLCSCIINLKSKISTFGFYSSSREIVFQLHTMNIKKIHIVALIAFPHQVSERSEKMFCWEKFQHNKKQKKLRWKSLWKSSADRPEKNLCKYFDLSCWFGSSNIHNDHTKC